MEGTVMKTLMSAALIASLLMGITEIAKAQALQPNNPILAEANLNSGDSLSPFNLVTFAYRGYLTRQGIPSYQAFDTGYLSGKITAERLIQSGISAQLVSPQALQDPSYLSAVESQLIRNRSRVY
jgi:hypothetical protein